MPQLEFEPTIPVFERQKSVRAYTAWPFLVASFLTYVTNVVAKFTGRNHLRDYGIDGSVILK